MLSSRRLYVSAVTSCVSMTWPSPSVSTRSFIQNCSPSYADRWLLLFWSLIWQTFPVVSGPASWTSSVRSFFCVSSSLLFILWAVRSNKTIVLKIMNRLYYYVCLHNLFYYSIASICINNIIMMNKATRIKNLTVFLNCVDRNAYLVLCWARSWVLYEAISHRVLPVNILILVERRLNLLAPKSEGFFL